MSLPRPFLLVLLFYFIRSVTPIQQFGGHDVSISLPSNTSQPFFSLNTSLPSVSSNKALNELNVRCDGATYGYNPNILDCEYAKEYLAPDTTQWTFGERHTGLPDDIVPLPYRVMGDKGLCYIDAVLTQDHKTARASLYQLRRAASALVLQCATGMDSQGGIVTGVGEDKNLAVVLGTYNHPVRCGRNLQAWESCRNLLYDMPADTKQQVFGPVSDPAVTEALPYSLDSADRKCAANLFTTGKSDVASFYNIWEGVTAIFSVCARMGLSGSMRGLGENGDILLTMTGKDKIGLPTNASLERSA